MAATPTSQPVAVDPAEYVLPAPPRQPGSQLQWANPVRSRFAAYRAAASVQTVGERMVALLECQERFLAELRTVLGDMDESVADESRARIKAQLGTLGEVLDWAEAVQGDLLQESRWAAAGCEPVDLAAACSEAAAHFRETHPSFSVTVLGTARRPVWIGTPALTTLLEMALAVVSERTRGRSGLAIEVSEGPGFATVRCAGAGEPTPIEDPELVACFRQAVSNAGASVFPDELGVGGTGLVIQIPSTPR